MGKIRVAQQTSEDAIAESDQQQDVLTKAKAKRKGKGKKIDRGNFYVNATYNNVSISVADKGGNVIAWSSSGSAGFKGPRKSTPYAASRVAEIVKEKVASYDFEEVHLFIKGIGTGRDSAIRSLVGSGLKITAIKDVTSIPHNGCRPPKPRRT